MAKQLKEANATARLESDERRKMWQQFEKMTGELKEANDKVLKLFHQTHFGHRKTYMWCLANRALGIVIFFYEDTTDENGVKLELKHGRTDYARSNLFACYQRDARTCFR